jgi:hypothetical protein
MPLKSLNVTPYFDDFDDKKNYQRILFRPGYPVQARELTQLQSILQDQIKKNSDHFFRNGTSVIPGNVHFDNEVTYIKLKPTYNDEYADSYLDDVVGETITGQTNGVVATVIESSKSSSNDPPTIFIQYESGSATTMLFEKNEVIESSSGILFQIENTTTYTGLGSIFSVEAGVYYINGHFVYVHPQSIVVSKYSAQPTTYIGLKVVEDVITEEDDSTLYDNALGFNNYAAPGAHRLQIGLELSSEDDLTQLTDETFIEIMKIVNGNIQRTSTVTEYSEIEKMLARRTYDESGDYIINPFDVTTRDYRDNYRGEWTENTTYLQGDVVVSDGSGAELYYYAKTNGVSGATQPTHSYGKATDGGIFWQQINSPYLTNGFYTVSSTETTKDQETARDKFIYDISNGKAYIRGFEVSVPEHTKIPVSKALTTESVNEFQVYAPTGTYVVVDNISGVPDISTYEECSLKDVANTTVGSAYVRSVEFVSGTPGTATATYKLFLVGIKMNTGKTFKYNANKIVIGASFSCDIVQSTKRLSGSVSIATGDATVTGKGTNFDEELEVGMVVVIDGQEKVVSSITSDFAFEASSNFSSTVADTFCDLVISDLVNLGEYVIKLPFDAIKTIRADDGSFDTSYIIMKSLSFTSSGTSYVYNLSSQGETFEPSGHILVRSDNTHINAGYALDITATQLTISGITAADFTLLAKIRRADVTAKEKIKTLSTKTIIVTDTQITTDGGSPITTASNYTHKSISLTEADVLRICKITMSGSTGAYNATNEVDVTDWFDMHDGIKPEVYSIGSITKKIGYPELKRAIKVTFEYFDHSDGDYFSIDSYSTVPHAYIPYHNGMFLGDCLDFRSRMSDSGIGFSGSGASISEPLVSDEVLTMDCSYYLPRVDTIYLSTNKQFKAIEGTPSTYPVATKSSNVTDLLIATVNVPAGYRANVITSIDIDVEEHKRYTMSSIGQIDKRLTNVEEFVALTALENDTAIMKIVDQYGLDRYKNGFMVDQFKNYDVIDTTNPDNQCVIDPTENEVRPTFYMKHVRLNEKEDTTESIRAASNYSMIGTVITLPYTSQVAIDQSLASTYVPPPAPSSSMVYTPPSGGVSISPVSNPKYSGTVSLYPARETWYNPDPTSYKIWDNVNLNNVMLSQKTIVVTVTGMPPKSPISFTFDGASLSVTPAASITSIVSGTGYVLSGDVVQTTKVDFLAARDAGTNTIYIGDAMVTNTGSALHVGNSTDGMGYPVKKVVNVKGTLTPGQGWVGSGSATITSVDTNPGMVTDSTGCFYGSFVTPSVPFKSSYSVVASSGNVTATTTYIGIGSVMTNSGAAYLSPEYLTQLTTLTQTPAPVKYAGAPVDSTIYTTVYSVPAVSMTGDAILASANSGKQTPFWWKSSSGTTYHLARKSPTSTDWALFAEDPTAYLASL